MVKPETHEKYSLLSQESNIPLTVLCDYIIDQVNEYNILDPDWIQILIKEKLEEYQELHDDDLYKKLELEKSKAINKARLIAFKSYIEVLDKDARKSFLENILGDMASGEFIEKLSNYQLYHIDGNKRFLLVGKNDRPQLSGVDTSKLVVCKKGYHIIGNFCHCNEWRDCKYRKKEYENYLARTDPQMKRGATRRYTQELDRRNRPY